jgi:hypothetical protein
VDDSGLSSMLGRLANLDDRGTPPPRKEDAVVNDVGGGGEDKEDCGKKGDVADVAIVEGIGDCPELA